MDKFHKSSNLTELVKTKNTHCASSIKLNIKNIQLMLVAMCSKVWVFGRRLLGLQV